jgi:hypothetical protein
LLTVAARNSVDPTRGGRFQVLGGP